MQCMDCPNMITDGTSHRCPTCKAAKLTRDRARHKRAAKRNYRLKHPAKPTSIKLPNSKTARQHMRIREYLDSFKINKPCTDCDHKFPPVCMDFHHRDPKSKDINLSSARTKSSIEAEIPKCDLLCACCHRLRHQSQDKLV
jgi:hypothetical protein